MTVRYLAELAPAVSDVVYAGAAVAFFAVAIAFARFCEKIR